MTNPNGTFGSKAASGCWQKIVGMMPKHDIYIEPFLGTGKVLREKSPVSMSYGIDKDGDVISAFRANFEIRHSLKLLCGSAIAFLDNFDYDRGKVLIYADPPYLPETRTSRNRYREEMTVADHIALLKLLAAVPAHVMLSGYPSNLYNDMLQGWSKIEFQAMTRGGPRTECVWFNYQPYEIAASSYAGLDFTDRQRIKRKVARWANKFKALPPVEQKLILSILQENQSRPL